MNKKLQRLTFIAILTTCSLTNSLGQTSIKEITDKFFTTYSTEPGKAIDYAFSTNKWLDRKIDEITDLKNKLKNLIEFCGDYYGYELLSEKTAGQNIKMLTFIIRYNREPIRFTFLFYKPNDKWQVNNFSYDESIGDDLQEAVKAYRLKENNEW